MLWFQQTSGIDFMGFFGVGQAQTACLSICFFPERCLQPVTQTHYTEGPLVPLIALVVPGHGFETPMRGTTVTAPSEPSCPPRAALGLGWCQEPGGQSVQGLPVVWGCLALSLQPALGAWTWGQLSHTGLGNGRGKHEGSTLNPLLTLHPCKTILKN